MTTTHSLLPPRANFRPCLLIYANCAQSTPIQDEPLMLLPVVAAAAAELLLLEPQWLPAVGVMTLRLQRSVEDLNWRESLLEWECLRSKRRAGGE